jgi:hypothetical protein
MSSEAQSEREAALAWRTVNIVHCLEVLGDLARVHAAPADSVLVGECFAENCISADVIIPG